MSYVITQDFIHYNNPGTSISPIGCVVHETATPNATDENEQDYFDSAYRGASAHAFVDYDSITQTIDWFKRAWHAGQTANNSYIGIELCHFDDPVKFNEVYKRGVWLFAYVFVNVLKKTTVTKDNLMSHAEVSAKWHETNHTDPVAYFASHGKSVDGFRADVQAEINRMITPQYPAYGTVTASVLNVRNEPNGAVIGTLKQGTQVKIAGTVGSWYNIYFGNSGGYIASQYVKR